MSESSELLRATINVSTLQEFLSPVDVFVDECKIQISSDGLQVEAVNATNAGMVNTHLSADAFEEYEGQESKIGVNLERLQEIVGMGQSDSLVQLVADSSSQTLDISVDSVSYTLGLIDPNAMRSTPGIPELDLSSEAELPGGYLNQGFKAADMVSSYIEMEFGSDPEQLVIRAEGNTDNVDVTYNANELESISTDADAEAMYSLEYMNKISKAIGGSNTVEMRMDDDKPVKIHFDIADGDGDVMFMVAPRITN